MAPAIVVCHDRIFTGHQDGKIRVSKYPDSKKKAHKRVRSLPTTLDFIKNSMDQAFRIWRISDSKCLESVKAHNDAINLVVAGFDGLVFTGSADGLVKVWRRELVGKDTKQTLVCTLLDQEIALTSVAVSTVEAVVYSGTSVELVYQLSHRQYISTSYAQGSNLFDQH
ncbi:hypothetical protein L1887_23717 [Cichorium endivia]|nr:hypothetical protein L1887_23717 [Cichorium endivia]